MKTEPGENAEEGWAASDLKKLVTTVRVDESDDLSDQEIDFVQDCRSLLRRQRTGFRGVIPSIAVAVVGAFLWWASWAEVEEVTRGVGRVIPSKSVQLIQSLEGGILEEIFVEEGEVVEKGQSLLRIRDAIFAAHYKENLVRRDELLVRIARHSAEAAGFADPRFPEDAREEFVELEKQLFEKRKADFEATSKALRERLELAMQAEKLLAAARESRAVSPIELIQVQKEVAELRGELATLKTDLERGATERLDEDTAELQVVEHTLARDKDRLDRTLIKAPVKGTVNKIYINTVGRVIASGIDIMEIVPLDDTLLIEANIRPSDIAFIRPDQDVQVKFTAYDFAVYGGMKGKVERLSVDTISNERGESFYQVRVRTDRSTLGTDKRGEELVIMPGMVTEVDITTGKKTIISYLMKPLTRARERALRER